MALNPAVHLNPTCRRVCSRRPESRAGLSRPPVSVCGVCLSPPRPRAPALHDRPFQMPFGVSPAGSLRNGVFLTRKRSEEQTEASRTVFLPAGAGLSQAAPARSARSRTLPACGVQRPPSPQRESRGRGGAVSALTIDCHHTGRQLTHMKTRRKMKSNQMKRSNKVR